MRLIRTLVAPEDREAVLDTLDETGVDYVVIEERATDDDRVVVEFPLPTQAVEVVLDALRDAGHTDQYTVVADAQSALSQNFDQMEERFVTGSEDDDSIAPTEIRSQALEMTPSATTYYTMTALSAVVATAGLLLGSPAVVVGSMVIAPLVGSALTTSVGTVLGEPGLVGSGLREQVGGLLVAVAAAALFGASLRYSSLFPAHLDVTTIDQLATRISPGLVSVVVGVCAGTAGAFALATGFSMLLVGVMIAAALVPAAAAVGVGIAWSLPVVAAGAGLLLVLNALAINATGVAVLWSFGYRPADTDPGESRVAGRTTTTAVAVALAAVLVLALVPAVGHVSFERTTNDAVTASLADESYADLTLVAVRADFSARRLLPGRGTSDVTVVVKRPADRSYPSLASALEGRIESRTAREVSLTVEFVERQRASPARSTASAHP